MKKQCEKCNFEYEYEEFANLMVFCPCCDDFAYKTALQVISDNKEYGDYIKVELV